MLLCSIPNLLCIHNPFLIIIMCLVLINLTVVACKKNFVGYISRTDIYSQCLSNFADYFSWKKPRKNRAKLEAVLTAVGLNSVITRTNN